MFDATIPVSVGPGMRIIQWNTQPLVIDIVDKMTKKTKTKMSSAYRSGVLVGSTSISQLYTGVQHELFAKQINIIEKQITD